MKLKLLLTITSALLLFTLTTNLSKAQTYCPAQGNACDFGYISNVKIKTINNTTPCSFYGDYTETHMVILKKDSSYTLTVSWMGQGTAYNYLVSAWVDFNKNGVFDEPAELFPLPASGLAVNSGSIAIPADAVAGVTRMRIRMVQNAAPASCGSQSRGEVEDYAVYIPGTGPINTAPSVNNDNKAVQTGVLTDINVLANDTDPDGMNGSSVTITSDPSNGTATVTAAGVIRYTSNASFIGKDTLKYRACDQNATPLCGSAFVYIDVVEPNSAPILMDDFSETLEATEDTIDVLVNDTDPENNIDSSTLAVSISAKNGNTFVLPDYRILYTPSIGFSGLDTFYYVLCDKGATSLCDDAMVVVNVLKAAVKPVPDFSFNANNLEVTFFDLSTNEPDGWIWSFGDGDSSYVQDPVHIYADSGTYNVVLIAYNSAGLDSVKKIVKVSKSTNLAPVAKFGYEANKLVVAFSDSSTNTPTSWLWTFDDGATSTVKNPNHTFATAGTYSVELLVNNAVGKDSITKEITVTNVGLVSEFESAKTVQIYPNPATANFTVTYDLFNKISETKISVLDITGKEICQVQMNAATQTIDASKLEQGVYLIRISDKNNSFIRRVEVVR